MSGGAQKGETRRLGNSYLTRNYTCWSRDLTEVIEDLEIASRSEDLRTHESACDVEDKFGRGYGV